MEVVAVILAGGRSERFGTDKLRLQLGGKPVWQWSVDTFLSHPEISRAILVVPEKQFSDYKTPSVTVVSGGQSRHESALAAVKVIDSGEAILLVHDAARPFVSHDLISRVISSVKLKGAAFPAVAPVDTIKEQTAEGWKSLNRANLVAVQTPQGCLLSQWRKAAEQAEPNMTDDMAMLEKIGVQTQRIEGDPSNFKITTQQDFNRAQAMVTQSEIRTGFGYDIHRFSTNPGRKLILGGLEFDDAPGLEGHSDADVVLHAVVDALLGAANLGDIGLLYANTDPRWKDAASSLFLTETAARLAQANWQIINIDITVLAEIPKIMPRRNEIAAAIAGMVGADVERVSIKATTHEGLGAIGRKEGIVAQAIATIRRTGE